MTERALENITFRRVAIIAFVAGMIALGIFHEYENTGAGLRQSVGVRATEGPVLP